MAQVPKTYLSHFVILLHSRVLDNEQPSWFVFEAKLPQKPLRTNVSLEWGWHLHCTQFSLTNRLITLIRLLRTQIVCYSFIFSSLCRIFLGNFEVFGSPWDLKAKPWDREMASQTVSVTVKPWELEGLVFAFMSTIWAKHAASSEQDGGWTATTQDAFPDSSIPSLATLFSFVMWVRF